jgi:hypothetical protein
MTHSITTRSLIFVSFLLGCGILAILVPGRDVLAAAPGYKVRMVSNAADDAREAVENGESPQKDCAMVSMQGKSIMEDHPDDKSAAEMAAEALEACNFELPVAYFRVKLDTVQKQLTASPDDPLPCNHFVREFTVYFSVASSAPAGADDPEERVKAALSERMREVCPFSAGMMRF